MNPQITQISQTHDTKTRGLKYYFETSLCRAKNEDLNTGFTETHRGYREEVLWIPPRRKQSRPAVLGKRELCAPLRDSVSSVFKSLLWFGPATALCNLKYLGIVSCFAVGFLLVGILSLGASNAAQNPATPAAAAPAGQSATAPAPPALPVVIDPKAQQFLDRCIQALGGDAFLTSKTLTTRGRTYSIHDEKTAGMAPFQSWFQYPDKRRFSYGKEKPVILINDGDRGWHLDQFGQFEQDKAQIQSWQLVTRYNLENVLRLRIHEPGALVQDGGVDFVDNLPAHVLEAFDAQHTHLKIYLNTKNFRPIRISYRIRNPQTQDFDDYSDVYSDYLPYEGIQTAMHTARLVNDERVSETFRTFAHYNDPYPPEYFQPVPIADGRSKEKK